MSGFVKAGFTFLKNLGSKQKTTGTEVIKSVKPNIPVTRTEKAKSKLAIAQQKTKGSKAKLNQAIFNLQEQNKAFLKATEKKADGGRIGRRFGSPNPRKTNVQKIKETFGPKKKVPSKFKGFSKLPEKVQQKIDAKLAKKV
jgi:N-formylglutamate amidohydrolase